MISLDRLINITLQYLGLSALSGELHTRTLGNRLTIH
jgi:hypothetical protein